VFELINGFHDAANSIATVVATKVLTANQGIVIAAVFELLGALAGTAVATTIGKGLVDTNYVTMATIMCGLLAGITWNLVTWWLGLPSSSSHALMGGLCGAALASAGNNWAVIKLEGIAHKVIIPMINSPSAASSSRLASWDSSFGRCAHGVPGRSTSPSARRRLGARRSWALATA